MWEIYDLDRNRSWNASVRRSPRDLYVTHLKTTEYTITGTCDISIDYEVFRREISGSVRRCSGKITDRSAGRFRQRRILIEVTSEFGRSAKQHEQDRQHNGQLNKLHAGLISF